jgi:hypothetical protein
MKVIIDLMQRMENMLYSLWRNNHFVKMPKTIIKRLRYVS